MTVVPEMQAEAVAQSDWIWRFRLECLKSVDDIVEAVVHRLEDQENDLDIDNTYFIYTSDHGFHLGLFKNYHIYIIYIYNHSPFCFVTKKQVNME